MIKNLSSQRAALDSDRGEGEVATMLVFVVLAVVLVVASLAGAFLLEWISGRPNVVWSVVVDEGYASRVMRASVALPDGWAIGTFKNCASPNEAGAFALNCGMAELVEMNVRYYGRRIDSGKPDPDRGIQWECRKTNSDWTPLECTRQSE